MPNTRKILIFSLVYYPHYVGGAEAAVKEIADRINPEVTEFHMITLSRSSLDKKEEKFGNVVLHRIGFPIFKQDVVSYHRFVLFINKLLYPVSAFFKANSLHKKYSFHATWSLMANYAGYSAYFFKIFNPRVSFILSLQEGDSEEHLKYKWAGLIDLSWRLTLKKADFLVAISNYLLDRAKTFGFRGEAYLIPNGVDLGKFDMEIWKDGKIKIRKDWGFKEDDVVLITSSRLNVKNGVVDVIKALANLSDNIKFIIFGIGELENELKKLVQKLNLESRVKFMGFVSHDDLPGYLKASDIFIRPSLSEGMGNSFLEAMAARLPVIATPVGGIVDFLRDGETGYFCKPEDPESIVVAVNRCVSDPNKNQVIENAYKMVVEKYDWNNIAVDMGQKIFAKI